MYTPREAVGLQNLHGLPFRCSGFTIPLLLKGLLNMELGVEECANARGIDKQSQTGVGEALERMFGFRLWFSELRYKPHNK